MPPLATTSSTLPVLSWTAPPCAKLTPARSIVSPVVKPLMVLAGIEVPDTWNVPAVPLAKVTAPAPREPPDR